MSSTFFHSSLALRAEEALARAIHVPGVGAFLFEGVGDALVDGLVLQDLAEPSPFSRTNTAIGTPQARWREITQSGRPAIMPLMRFWPAGGTQCVTSIACSARARSVSPGLALP